MIERKRKVDGMEVKKGGVRREKKRGRKGKKG
jgi:hypothetical protein